MKTKNKIITAILLSVGSLVGTELINKYIKISAVSKNLLKRPEPLCYKWRLGNIFYTKTGSGKPILLIHDLDYYSSGCEWENLIPLLSEHYTVYTVDLLGCGRSEKPNLTYTNYLYVQFINDFIKSEIGHRTNIIASGSACSLVTMSCAYNQDLYDKIMFINPESFQACSQIPGKSAKLYKLMLDTPILGTLLYNIASSKAEILAAFKERLFYNPFEIDSETVEKYHEAAHLGDTPKAVYSSVRCNYTKCSISHALEKIDNSIYLLCGAAEPGADEVINEYIKCNPAIEAATIADTKHLPHLEKAEETAKAAKIFFG